MGDVAKISQRQTDHVDSHRLPMLGDPPGYMTGGWFPVRGRSKRHDVKFA